MNGINKYTRVALDSNIFIYQFENNLKFIEYVDEIFERLASNNLHAVTSIISVIETLSFPLPVNVVEEIEQAFKTAPNLTILDLDHEIALFTAQIRRKYKSFKLPDAVQLATAIAAKSQTFITNDSRLKVFKELPITLLTKI